jgi:tRNA threonylcarbamoyladenosine biosynthesis protein TsaE
MIYSEGYYPPKNIKSPTFTYVIGYDTGDIKVYHFDVYRITNEDELYEIGFEEYMQKMISLT